MEKGRILGYGSKALSEEELAMRKAYDAAKKDYERVNRMRNAALISDFASGLLNITARKHGSLRSLPTTATATVNPYYLQARETSELLRKGFNEKFGKNPDYSGEISRNTLFAKKGSGNNQGGTSLHRNLAWSRYSVYANGKSASNNMKKGVNLIEKWRIDNLTGNTGSFMNKFKK